MASHAADIMFWHAQVAELVDALASGASDLLVVEVRVFSWAPPTQSGIVILDADHSKVRERSGSY